MSLRSRIALLVGVTVLLASMIGGIGTALSSRNVGRDRVDQALIADAAQVPPDARRLGAQLQITFELQRRACDEVTGQSDTTDEPLALDEVPRGPGDRRFERVRGLPAFASSMQWIRSNGTAVSACEALPINEDEIAVAQAGSGTNFRTVVIDDERFRVLTQGYDGLGAVQFARSLEITQDTLRSLLVRSLGFGLVGAALAAAFGWLFASRTTAPLERLSAAAERVAETHDLGERIEVTGNDEISTLASSFNSMLSTLDTSRGQQHQLVQDASHELRTPLTSMRTNVELLQRHRDIDPVIREQVLSDISSELNELTALTAELVESATEIPSTVQNLTAVDLREIVTDCVGVGERRHRRPISIAGDEAQSSMVAGDANLLARCITNLINNAVKFSGESADIEVYAEGTAVHVRDRGPGIAEQDLPRIFDRFYRATEARSAPGSGLGLAIVKQIVEGHRGEVHASNRPGGGAEIGFTLPALTDRDEATVAN